MKLMQFLSGLDDTFSQVKSHILLMEPLPNLEVAFSVVSYEESYKRVVRLFILPQSPKLLDFLVDLMM